jgi:hypothetical protein
LSAHFFRQLVSCQAAWLTVCVFVSTGCRQSVTRPDEAAQPIPADGFHRPFAAGSPWNTRIAQYASAVYTPTAALRSLATPAFSAFSPWLEANWLALYQARESDPLVGIYYHPDAWAKVATGEWQRWGNSAAVEAEIRRGMTQTWSGHTGNPYSTTDPNGFRLPVRFKHREDPYWSLQAHVPADALPTPDADGLFAVFQPNGTVLELIAAIRLSTGELVSLFASYTDPAGSGDGAANGRRASMVPAYAGVIRNGELAAGRIEHALCAAVGPEALAREIRWPAAAMDRNPTDYAGPLPMGALLALPPRTTAGELGLRTREGRIVADAAREYGIYVVDRSGPRAFVLCTERDAHDVPSWHSEIEADLRRIRDALQLVTVSH